MNVIACIDDDASIREALEGLLLAFGYEALMFSSAEEFLKFEQKFRISCVVSDIYLGGISGLQLQRRMIEMGIEIPLIIITAFDDERMEKQALDAGAINFLHKPITREDLMSSIEMALKHAAKEH